MIHAPLVGITLVVLLTGCHKKPPVEEVTQATETPALPPTITPAPPPAPPVVPLPSTDRLTTIHFDFDRAELRPDQIAVLETNLRVLRADQDLRIEIQGHCDERGSTDYNLALGDRRAQAARTWLLAQGVAPGRIRFISYGEEMPVDPGHDESAWWRNRRDEFVPTSQPVVGR